MATKKKSPEKIQQSLENMKALKLALDKIDKDFGTGTCMRMGDKPKVAVQAISTGSIGIDLALGVFGLPKGRIIEIYGPESSGKTTLALHVIAKAQSKGEECVLVDAEHAFDPDYAKKLGVDVENLLISQPDYGEMGLEVVSRLLSTKSVGVIVVDSVAALVPKSEIDGEMGENKMGVHARLMSQAMRKLTGLASKTNTLLIFINQLRDKIGVMFGNPETTTGGNALKFYASVRIDMRKIAVLKDGDEAYGNRVKVKIVKNKCAPPFRTAEVDLIYGEGWDRYSELIDIASGLEIIKKSGSWFSYNDDKLGQGKEQVKKLLIDNPELNKEIYKLVKQKLNQ